MANVVVNDDLGGTPPEPTPQPQPVVVTTNPPQPAPAVPANALIDVIKETTTQGVELEQAKQEIAELTAGQEMAETRIKWTQEDINNLFQRLDELSDRISQLELKEANEENMFPGVHGEESEEGTEIEEFEEKEESKPNSRLHNFLW